jgi:hypothetical protein
MKTEGIEGFLIETHNWGKTVAFWQGLGYERRVSTCSIRSISSKKSARFWRGMVALRHGWQP